MLYPERNYLSPREWTLIRDDSLSQSLSLEGCSDFTGSCVISVNEALANLSGLVSVTKNCGFAGSVRRGPIWPRKVLKFWDNTNDSKADSVSHLTRQRTPKSSFKPPDFFWRYGQNIHFQQLECPWEDFGCGRPYVWRFCLDLWALLEHRDN